MAKWDVKPAAMIPADVTAKPVAWRTGSDVTLNSDRARNWIAMGVTVYPMVDASALAAQTARAEAAEARADDLTAKLGAMRAALSHTADQALAAEIPVGYGPEDKGAWTQGYDAAIRHARAALKTGGA